MIFFLLAVTHIKKICGLLKTTGLSPSLWSYVINRCALTFYNKLNNNNNNSSIKQHCFDTTDTAAAAARHYLKVPEEF